MTTVEIRVRSVYDTLNNAEKLAADYLLKNLEDIFRYPLATLAELSGTSQGAWVRFCKSIDYSGMKELKNALFRELNASAVENHSAGKYQFTDIKSHSDLPSLAKNVCSSSILAIEDTLTLFDADILEALTASIIKARKIAVFGLSASGIAAQDFYNKLLRIGYPVVFSNDYHVSLTIAATLTKKDIAICISNSGETDEILKLAAIAKKRHAAVGAITKYGKNRLNLHADFTLCTSSPETDKRSGAMSSRIAQLVMTDILFTAIANRDYEKIASRLEHTYQVFHGTP